MHSAFYVLPAVLAATLAASLSATLARAQAPPAAKTLPHEKLWGWGPSEGNGWIHLKTRPDGTTITVLDNATLAPVQNPRPKVCEDTVLETGFTGCEQLLLHDLYTQLQGLEQQQAAIRQKLSDVVGPLVGTDGRHYYDPPSPQFPVGRLMQMQGDDPGPQGAAGAISINPTAGPPNK